MRDIEDLRRALDEAAADSPFHLPPDRVRRRARVLRARRGATVGAVAVVAAVALVVPTVLLGRGPAGGSGDSPVGQASSQSADPTPQPVKTEHVTVVNSLGTVIDTGATLEAPNLHTSFDVLLYLTGPQEAPGFVIAFRNQGTGVVENWDTSMLVRSPKGDLSGKRPGDPTIQFLGGQLVLGPNDVLDMGLFGGKAARITVASGGQATNADTAVNNETGWTFFWAERDAAPLPDGALNGPNEYTGPERLTITAYASIGARLASVTGGFQIGHPVQNPRDGSPEQTTGS
jgi:hypothetical protein